jgi:hypothetical protein
MRRFYTIALYAIYAFPHRIKKLKDHLLFPFFINPKHLKPVDWYDWPIDLLFYLFDVFFISDILEMMLIIFKPNTRSLNDLEHALLYEVYGDTIPLDYIKLDTTARFLTKKYSFAYVSFNTINYWHSMMDQILVHEAMHIYQYHRFGSVYIYRALKAQNSSDAYDYGGIPGLSRARQEDKSLFDFNFEQQASIIEDYFEISQRLDLIMMPGLMGLYQHFRSQLFQ